MNKCDLAAKLTKATLDDMERPMSNKDDVVGLVEPSDWERSQWLQATEAYVCGLEDALTTLSARVETLEAALKQYLDDPYTQKCGGSLNLRARHALAGDTNHG